MWGSSRMFAMSKYRQLEHSLFCQSNSEIISVRLSTNYYCWHQQCYQMKSAQGGSVQTILALIPLGQNPGICPAAKPTTTNHLNQNMHCRQDLSSNKIVNYWDEIMQHFGDPLQVWRCWQTYFTYFNSLARGECLQIPNSLGFILFPLRSVTRQGREENNAYKKNPDKSEDL